ncbi:MAG: hypothetical protein GTO12_03640 [Proteobacteria bacterium]|nr:hypothetical protein [Pseudomonadota bacterium]
MDILKRIGRIISSAANVMSCAQGICFKPGEGQSKSEDNFTAVEKDGKGPEPRSQPIGSISLGSE